MHDRPTVSFRPILFFDDYSLSCMTLDDQRVTGFLAVCNLLNILDKPISLAGYGSDILPTRRFPQRAEQALYGNLR